MYGTLSGGYIGGAVFCVGTDGSDYRILKRFTGVDGADPEGGLTRAGTVLFGTTQYGGISNCGTIFRLNTDGSGFAVLKQFTSLDGANPVSGVVYCDNVLYGTTLDGVLFSLSFPGEQPEIRMQPQSQTVEIGSVVNFGVQAGGLPAPSYQWFFNGTNLLDGATGPAFELVDVQPRQSGAYTVVITNVFGAVTSTPAILTVYVTPPAITSPPTDRIAYLGDAVQFAVTAVGTSPLAYQWFFNATNPVPAARDSVLQLLDIQFSQSGAYTVVITNAFGAVTSPPAFLVVRGYPPAILSSSPDQTIGRDEAVEFSVSVSGTPPLAYQWFFDVTDAITGANDSVLLLTNVQFSQSGVYTVVVTNAFGSVTSSPAMLVVQGYPPTILTPPSNQTVAEDDTVGFAVSASGTRPLTYQWFFNSTNAITGATDSDLLLTNIQFSQAGTYTVVVTNAFGAITSSPAMLRVLPLTRVVAEPTDADLRVQMSRGGNVTFDCDGTIPLDDTITVTTNTTLDGTGHQITISGNDLVRVFRVETNVSFTVSNLTIASGAALSGAGILNDGGVLTLQGVTIQSNTAVLHLDASADTDAGMPEGGGILNRGGSIYAINCAFLGNVATIQYAGLSASNLVTKGGAVSNERGLIYLEDCLLAENSAASSVPAGNYGGAIQNSDEITANRCQFLNNSAATNSNWNYIAGYFGQQDAGVGKGGAICNDGVMSISSSVFSGNLACGNAGGQDVSGGSAAGGAMFNSGVAALNGNTLVSNTVAGGPGGWGGLYEGTAEAGQPGAAGGDANGGALFNSGVVRLANNTFVSNMGMGGPGGSGGPGHDGWTVLGSPPGAGGAGGTGGSASGGAICDVSGLCYSTNCTFADNFVHAGGGGSGGPYGEDFGNPDWYRPDGPDGPSGSATCGGISTVGGALINTLLAANDPSNGSATIIDAGHNLSSDDSCSFTNVGSLNNTDPMLGPLADNGGPTLTMALLPGSPAIDAGDTALAPSIDQRGFSRPAGVAADIGAYEAPPVPPVILTSPTDQLARPGAKVVFSVDAIGSKFLNYQWFFNLTNALDGATNSALELLDVQPVQSGVYTVVVTNIFGAATSAPATLAVFGVPTSAFGDEDWVSLNPGIPGANGSISAIAVDDRGNIYVGGYFNFIGTVPRITSPNGTAKVGRLWAQRRGITYPFVDALAVSGTNLYVGGSFTTAGGVPANGIAKWDGSSWSALGSGMGNYRCVCHWRVSGTDLYAGGWFTTAGGVPANYIAKWDGQLGRPWDSGCAAADALGVYALAVSGTDLYAGGKFSQRQAGCQANYIAKWDGSAWSALGSGVGSTI